MWNKAPKRTSRKDKKRERQRAGRRRKAETSGQMGNSTRIMSDRAVKKVAVEKRGGEINHLEAARAMSCMMMILTHENSH